MDQSPNPVPILIKRYQNHKLYNTNLSCYITLSDLQVMVLAGQAFTVLDNKSKRDITAWTLMMCLFDQESRREDLPVDQIRNLIKTGLFT